MTVQPMNSRLQLLLSEKHSRVEVLRNINQPEKISNVCFYDGIHPSHKNRRKTIYPEGSQLRRIIAVMSILLDEAGITDTLAGCSYEDRTGLCSFLLLGMDPVFVYETGRTCYRACMPPLTAKCEHFMEEGANHLYDFMIQLPEFPSEARERLRRSRLTMPPVVKEEPPKSLIPRKRSFTDLSSDSEPLARSIAPKYGGETPSPSLRLKEKGETVIDAQFLRILLLD